MFKVIVICLLIVVIALLVIDISERNREDIIIAKVENPIIPSVVSSFSSREINYVSHITSTGRVSVLDNSNAKDVSYSELLSFLLEDQTDKIIYREGVFSCSEFSQTLQHNAEKKGIRCAWVYVDLLEIIDHSLNAFLTTDRGLIFVDDSGVITGLTHPYNMDKVVALNRGQRFCPESLFPESGWSNKWNCTGTVVDYKIYWAGDM